MKRRRVKITGIGPVTPAGIGREGFWTGLLEPISRVRQFSGLPHEFGEFVAAYVDDFDLGDYCSSANLPRGISRQTQFAIAGAVLALDDAGLSLEAARRLRSVVVTGSCLMDFASLEESFHGVQKNGPRGALPRNVYVSGVGSVSAAIGAALELTDRSVAVSNQCSSGMDAIAYAASMIAHGEADIAVCGGTDATMHQTPFLEMRAGRWITRSSDRAEEQVRPFDRWRTTGALAEGCSMLVLESEESSNPGYSWISGASFASDTPEKVCSGLISAARLAIADAHIRCADIEVLNAWGPGDMHVDEAECAAMAEVFREHLPAVAATSIKGSIGSALGAAPAIQVAAAAIAQKQGVIPPTVNWRFPDPKCALNLSASPRFLDHRYTLVNSHGITAVNGCMVLERC